MMTYILLRNNKESGPHTLEGLRQTGLRASDLVWVEGQSVCWLLPAEIRELRDLVVAGENTPAHSAVLESVTSSGETQPAVSMMDIPVVPAAMEVKPATVNEALSSYMPPVTAVSAMSGTITTEQEPVVETKYVRPLDELKEMYAKDLERRMRNKKSIPTIPLVVRKFGLYTALIAAGLFAGILIMRSGNKDGESSQPPAQPAASISQETSPTPPPAEKIPEPEPLVQVNDVPEEKGEIPARPVQEPVKADKKSQGKKQTGVTSAQDRVINPDEKINPVSTPDPGNSRNAVMRDESKILPAGLMEKVSVTANDYIVGSFGGIKNLQLTVTNGSDHALSRVIVELQYLKPRDEFIKADQIVFRSLAPGGSQTLAIPKSARGVKVRYKIIRIDMDDSGAYSAGN